MLHALMLVQQPSDRSPMSHNEEEKNHTGGTAEPSSSSNNTTANDNTEDCSIIDKRKANIDDTGASKKPRTITADTNDGCRNDHIRRPTWNARFEELVQFKARMGHCLVPKMYPLNAALGRWVGRQRSQYKLRQEGQKGGISDDRVSKLEQLGFVWHAGPSPGSNNNKKKLVASSATNNATSTSAVATSITQDDIPPDDDDKTYLIIQEISDEMDHQPLSTEEEPLATSNEIDQQPLSTEEPDVGNSNATAVAPLAPPPTTTATTVVSRQEIWELRFQELVIFKETHGHCVVPRTVPVLGRWVKKQREHYKRKASGKNSSLTSARYERLAKLGFVWGCPQRDDWNARFQQLKEYKAMHGNCLVPKRDLLLGRWVGRQRSIYKDFLQGKSTSLTQERINLLTEIDFVWSASVGNLLAPGTANAANAEPVIVEEDIKDINVEGCREGEQQVSI